MNSGTQVELDWAPPPSARADFGGQAAPPANAPASAGNGGGAYLTDEEILGITPIGKGAEAANNSESGATLESVGARFTENALRERHAVPLQPTLPSDPASMPAWMQTIAGDPQHGAEAHQLWQEHQAFRAAFASPDEARAIRELFPGGAQEARTLRQAAQAVDQIDAAIYSGDARAQSEVVAELARANPAAFRSLFAEAAKVLAGMGQRNDAVARLFRGGEVASPQGKGPGSEDPGYSKPPSPEDGFGGLRPDGNHASSQISASPSQTPGASPSQELRASQSQVTSHQSPTFDPVAYSNFERATNDVVARDVRSSISDTLTRVLPEGVAEGTARRIGDDIFNEVHRALASDRTLSMQVGDVLRDRRFGTVEQQRVSSLLAGRAKQLVPSVARRVIGEWTSSVLGTARSKAARQATVASRVDIGAPGGSLDSMPLRAMSPREVDYASMSDDEILGM